MKQQEERGHPGSPCQLVAEFILNSGVVTENIVMGKEV